MILPAPDLTEATNAAFVRRYGSAPSSIARAPGRVNVIGEHTDYLGGRCLPVALPYATWVATAPRTDPLLRLSSGTDHLWTGRIDALDPQAPLAPGWQAYVLGTLRAVGWSGGLDLHVESAVPWGAGLSSSAALICAVAAAVTTAPLPDLLDACIAAEQVHVGAPTGGMDQTVALLARRDHALALDFATPGRPAVRPVPWQLDAAGMELLVVDTGVRHDNADGTFARRRAESEAALALTPEALAVEAEPLPRRRRHVESENRRVDAVIEAAGRGDFATVGPLLTASHASLRDDLEVSCAELDLVVEVATKAGALGARMTGGGFGGCAVVLSPVGAREAVCRAVEYAAREAGHPEPRFLSGKASGPATRIRSAGPPGAQEGVQREGGTVT